VPCGAKLPPVASVMVGGIRVWRLCLACVISCSSPESPGLTVDAGAVDAPDGSVCTASTDLATDPRHCGRCDHACGGATCVQGECQPLELARDIPGLGRLAVTDTAIYWIETQRIASCPLPQGCVLAPRSVADPFDRLDLLAVQGDALFFVGCSAGADSCDDRQRLFECPTSGCPLDPLIHMSTDLAFKQLEAGAGHLYLLDDRPEVFHCSVADCGGTDTRYGTAVFGSAMLGLSLDGETLYVDVEGDLRTCPVDGGCATPGTLMGTASIGAPFVVRNGLAFWVISAGPGRLRIYSCTVASCNAAAFANEVNGVSELRADDSGLYWINHATGTIRHCPLSGCPAGGATYVARNLTGPANLTLGPGFVYYTAGGSIYKIAKP
jgi:hypothetical protein